MVHDPWKSKFNSKEFRLTFFQCFQICQLQRSLYDHTPIAIDQTWAVMETMSIHQHPRLKDEFEDFPCCLKFDLFRETKKQIKRRWINLPVTKVENICLCSIFRKSQDLMHTDTYYNWYKSLITARAKVIIKIPEVTTDP